MWYINVDGASRGNPGKSGVGIVIKEANNFHFKQGFFVGTMTNNQAEYWALIIALAVFVNRYSNSERLIIRSDSQLLVNQLNGSYSVKNPELKILHQRVFYFLNKISSYAIEHVYREQNVIADELANVGIDQQILVPQEIKNYIIKT